MMTVATKIDWMVTICQELVLSVYGLVTVDPHDNLIKIIITILILPMRILKIRDVEQNAQQYPARNW